MTKLYGKNQITEAEHLKRAKAVNYARASVELEGLKIHPRYIEISEMYVNGDITSEEKAQLKAEVRFLDPQEGQN